MSDRERKWVKRTEMIKSGVQLCKTVVRRMEAGVADALQGLQIYGMGGSVRPRVLRGRVIFKGRYRCQEQFLPFLGPRHKLEINLLSAAMSRPSSQFNCITYKNK